MQREEKRRKFHDSLLNVLYPPLQQEENGILVNKSPEGRNAAQILDEIELEEAKSSSSSSNGECETQKLTRAQRKRLRRKKLREAASQRRQIIGPLLPHPPIVDGEEDVIENDPQDIRQNAADDLGSGFNKPGEQASCSNHNKLKQRRIAKMRGREKQEQKDFIH